MFKECIKKEIREELRTKRFLRFCLSALAMVLLTLIIFVLMNAVSKITINNVESSEDMFSAITGMFKPTYHNYTMYFATFILTYFTIIYIIMIMNVFSKEISQNKWLLPISAGITPESMICSKLIIKTLSIIFSILIAILLHFITLLIFFKPTSDFGVLKVLLSYLGITLFTMFLANLTMAINAISKKGWVSALTAICLLILGTSILEAIAIKGVSIICYTPFMFYEIAMNPFAKLNVQCVIFAVVMYVAIFALLFIWAIKSNKIKPNKVK